MRKIALVLLIVCAALLLAIALALPIAVPWAAGRYGGTWLERQGYPSDIAMTFDYCWRRGPGIEGSLRVAVRGTPWCVKAKFGASFGEWQADVSMPETEFSESDPALRRTLERYPLKAVSNLVFSGSVALDAKIRRTPQMPVPVWSVKVPVCDLSAHLFAGGKEMSVEGFSVTAGASGIADHVDISPLFPRAKKISAVGCVLSDFHASVRATEKSLLVTEAEASFCGGKVSLYSVFLDPKRLNAGFTVFLDEVETGEALTHFKGFRGDASGRLHGKIRLFVKEGGKAVRFSDAFLYSTPGETGKLQMSDSTALTSCLAMSGLDDAQRDNVAKALTDLDYSVLRLNLRRGEGRSATLSVRLEGTVTRGGVTVPVNLNLNINGELEQLVNTGLGVTQLKEKMK